MKFYSLKCPECGANLEAEEGTESFYCRFCGAKVIMDHISKSEMRVREMEHDERLSEHKMKVRLEKAKAKRLDDLMTHVGIIACIVFSIIFIIGVFILVLVK